MRIPRLQRKRNSAGANSFRSVFVSSAAAVCASVAAVLSSGCAAVDIFNPPPVLSEEAWYPPNITQHAPPVSGEKQQQRTIAKDDRVVITLRTSMNLNGEQVEDIVDDLGNVTLPLLGEFGVLGMTASDAGKAIANAYLDRGYYRDMVVNFVCMYTREEEQLEYSVTGAVNHVGRFPLRENMGLWEAIIAAGDVNDFAGDTITLTRRGVIKDFSYRKIKKGLTPSPTIQHGDIISVKSRWL